MSASILITGRLFREPERKTSKSGKPFIFATFRDGEGDAVIWWKVLAFGAQAIEELSRLGDGDAVSVSGGFKGETYTKDGEARMSLTVFADRAISAPPSKRERKRDAAPARSEPSPAARVDINDPIPF